MDRAGERDAGVPDPGFAGDRVLPYQPGGPLDVPLTYAGQSAAPGVLGLRPRWNDARLHDGATPGGRARARTWLRYHGSAWRPVAISTPTWTGGLAIQLSPSWRKLLDSFRLSKITGPVDLN